MAQNAIYQPTDPIISSNFSPFSSSVSRVRHDAQTSGSLPSARATHSTVGGDMSKSLPAAAAPTTRADERAPLLGSASSKKPFYRPRPLW